MAPSASPRLSAAARRVARSLISTSDTSRAWTPAHEKNLRALLTSSHGPPLNPSFLSAVIDPHLLRHAPLAAGLFHWASLQPGFSHSPISFHSLLKSLSLARNPPPLLPLLRLANAHQIPLLPASYHLAISVFLNSNQPFEAFDLIDRVHEVPDDLYNSVLSSIASTVSLELARKLFDKMLDRGVIFSDLGFGVFIRRCCEVLCLDGVLGLVDKVRGPRCQLNGSVLAVLIVNGLCRAGRIDEAWRALGELRCREWKSDFISYRVVSEAFRLAGRLEEAGRVLKQKRKFGVAPRAKDYGEFILLLISARQIQEAKELGVAIVYGDFPIEDNVLNALVSAVSTVDPDAAVLFCKHMIKKERFPSTTLLSNLSRNLCKNKKTIELWNIFSDLSARGYFDGVERYNLMISFLCKAGRVREAYDVLKEMKKKGFGPDICSYNLLMEACCREDLVRPAKKLWDEMFANGCCPNLQTYRILIQKFTGMGDVEEAKHLYQHMLEKGVSPDNATIGSLVKLLCQENRVGEALEIFNKSIEKDIKLASSILSMLVISLSKEGNFVAALSVLHGLPSELEDSDAHILLLKSLTDSGNVKMATEHIEWVRSNCPFKLQKISAELIASLSTAPKLEPTLELLGEMHAQGLISNDQPIKNILESWNTDS